jgi:dihydrofolate reductase
VGRRTFEELRGYWPKQSDDATGIADYLNQLHKYVVSSTMTEPEWQNSTIQHHAVPQADRSRAGRRVPAVHLLARPRPQSPTVP